MGDGLITGSVTRRQKNVRNAYSMPFLLNGINVVKRFLVPPVLIGTTEDGLTFEVTTVLIERKDKQFLDGNLDNLCLTLGIDLVVLNAIRPTIV
jgi:hypothetical protein